MEQGGFNGGKRLLYSKAADRICQYIKDENLQPGDKLPGERKLASEWQVSRPTIREAIRELENTGVIRVEVGKGTFVTDYVESRQLNIRFALKNFYELFEVKTVLERYSLERAIPNIPEDKLNRLEKMAVKMNQLADEGIIARDIDHEFHKCILNCYGNQEMTNLVCNMIEAYETFDDELYGYFDDKDFDYKPVLLKTFEYHLEMVKSMKKRNVAETLKNYDEVVKLDLEVFGRIK